MFLDVAFEVDGKRAIYEVALGNTADLHRAIRLFGRANEGLCIPYILMTLSIDRTTASMSHGQAELGVLALREIGYSTCDVILPKFHYLTSFGQAFDQT